MERKETEIRPYLEKEESNPPHSQKIVLSIVNEDIWYLRQ